MSSTGKARGFQRRSSRVEDQVQQHRERPRLSRSFSSSFEKPITKRKRNVDDILAALQKESNGSTKAKNILVRVDFNVPMHPDGTISNDSRIRGALPTIEHILDANASDSNTCKFNVILMSHMGRPKKVQSNADGADEQRKTLSLKPAAVRLGELLDHDVQFALDCIGPVADEAVAALPVEGGGVLVLENLRFYKQEEKNVEDFAKSLAKHADVYINDAFGTSHRAHASVTGVPALLPPTLCGVGCLVASEVSYLDFDNLDSTASVTAIIGGSKVSTKLPVIQGLLKKVDVLVLGGGLAFTFLKAQGVSIGNSLLEESMLETAKELLVLAKKEGKEIVLPVDARCGTSFPTEDVKEEDTKLFDLTVEAGGIEDGWSGFDVGPKTVKLFEEKLKGTTKLVFNGPMGVFETKPYHLGTLGLILILEDLTKSGTITVVGGGDSVAALEAAHKSNVVSYISTGGGATLELLSGLDLPGVAAIGDVDN